MLYIAHCTALAQGQHWKATEQISPKVPPNIVKKGVNIPNPESLPKMPFLHDFVFIERSST